MKILVATRLTQGAYANDYHYCVEGELVWIQEPCDRGADDPDGSCGCGRGFAGAASHRATTTATVVESPMSRADLVLAGCAILDAVHRCWPVERLQVADRGLREGILNALMGQNLRQALARADAFT